MKITKIENVMSVQKFKNKEDFCNRLIQEIMVISKNNLFHKKNKKIEDLSKYKNKLISKEKKLDSLLEKSKSIKEDLNNKINLLVEDNVKYKNRLLNNLQVVE